MAKSVLNINRPKRASFFRVRFQIALMGALCPIVCYISRQNISMAIVAMVVSPTVKPTLLPDTAVISTATQSPSFGLQGSNQTANSPRYIDQPSFTFDDRGGADGATANKSSNDNSNGSDQVSETQLSVSETQLASSNSCPLPKKQVEGQADVLVESVTYGPKYSWSASQRGFIFEAFFYAYVIFQIPAARFAEKAGAKWILATATIGSSLLSLLSPWAASLHPLAFALLRAIMGVCQAALYPACYILYSRWLPPTERSLGLPILGAGAYIGSIVAVTATGFFVENKLFGWEFAFYLPSFLCAIWSVVWILVGASSPQEHTSLSFEELEYIESRIASEATTSPEAEAEKGQAETRTGAEAKEKARLSWTKIFRSQHIWAMLAGFMASNWAFSVIIMLLPSYLNYILRIPPFENSIINAIIYVLYCIASPIVGAVSTLMIEVRAFGMTRIQIRKLFQSIAVFSSAASFVAIPYLGCDKTGALMLLYAQIVFYSFVNGGEVQLPAEISLEFAGTIYAIGNSVGSSTGFLVPRIHSLIVTTSGSRDQWNTYFYIASTITSAGGLLFLLFGKNDPQDFSKDETAAKPDIPADKLGGERKSVNLSPDKSAKSRSSRNQTNGGGNNNKKRQEREAKLRQQPLQQNGETKM